MELIHGLVLRDVMIILFYQNIGNELHYCIYKHPHVSPYPNVSELIRIKVNGNMLNKRKELIQFLAHELHNDLLLPVSKGGFSGARDEEGRELIGNTILRKYTPNHIKQTININNIKCGCEACIIAMFVGSMVNLVTDKETENKHHGLKE